MPPKRRNPSTPKVVEDSPRAGRQSSRNANKVVKYKEVDSDDEDKPKRRRAVKPKEPVASSESNASGDNYDSEEDKKEKTKKVLPAKKRRSAKEPEVSDEEEDDEEDEKKVVKNTKRRGRDPVDSVAMETKRKPTPVKKVTKKHDDDEDNEGEAEEEEEEDDGKRTPSSTKKSANKHDEEEDEEEEDEDMEKSDSEEDSKGEKNGSSKNNVKMVKLKPPSKKATPGAEKKLLNKTDSDYSTQDFTSDKTTTDGKPWNLKISSWNVGGLKAWIKKNGLDYIKHEKPDILCLQETKCSKSKLPPEANVDGYHAYWLSGEKEGYAGIAIYSKEKPIEVKYGIDVEEYDSEGRVITAEYEKFYVVAVYVPNSGRGLVTLPRRKEWDPELRSYVKELDSKKPVIICGDMNVSHEAIDLANPKSNTKNAGFTQEERDGMTELLKEGFVDSFRKLYPEQTGAYTFWTYMGNARSRNVGWRLDYFVLSEKLVPALCDSLMRSEVFGSDHCPITLLLHV